MGTIIIEEISRNHKLIGRHKYSQSSINIGRGYDNDVIISDPHVCPEHINISFDGEQWIINDLNSVNGCFIGDKKHNADQHVINSGDVLSFGKSQIRIIFPDHPVSPSVLFSPFESLINLARNTNVLIFSLLLFCCLSAYLIYLSKPTETTFSQLFVPSIGMTLIFALWPCGVSLVSHLTKNDARLWTQIGISFVIFNLFWLTDFLEKILLFNSSNNLLVNIFIILIPITLSFVLFWLNAYIGFHMSSKRRTIVASGLVILFFGGSTLVKFSNKLEFSAYPSYESTIMAPTFLFTDSSSVTTFLTDSEKLFAAASADAQEPN